MGFPAGQTVSCNLSLRAEYTGIEKTIILEYFMSTDFEKLAND
jgi:hypothetical protein